MAWLPFVSVLGVDVLRCPSPSSLVRFAAKWPFTWIRSGPTPLQAGSWVGSTSGVSYWTDLQYSRLESSWDLEEYDGIGLSPDPPWLQVWEVFMKHWNNSIYPTGWAQKWCPPQWFNHWTALSHEGGIMDDLQHFIFDDVESKGSAGCRCRTESCLWGGGWSIPRWKSWGKSIEVFHE